MILYSNDAKSCYDQMVHSIASITIQRMGMPKPPIVAIFRTIEQAEHFIRTTFGDSTLSINSRNLIKPYQGILQGNGVGLVIWIVTNAPMIEV